MFTDVTDFSEKLNNKNSRFESGQIEVDSKIMIVYLTHTNLNMWKPIVSGDN